MPPPGPHKTDAPDVKRRCHRCHGSGRAPCQICNGSGQVRKGNDRQGRPHFERCEGCFGLKTTRCRVCSGEGFVPG